MLLDARQKTANATNARSNDARFSSCCAKTIPTKRTRFFVHCLGRIDNSNARKRLPVPDLEDLIALVVLEECNPFCSSVCCSCVTVKFSKSYRIPLQRQKTQYLFSLCYVQQSVRVTILPEWSSWAMICSVSIDASLQIGCTMERDSMFIGSDIVLICKIAQHLIDTLT